MVFHESEETPQAFSYLFDGAFGELAASPATRILSRRSAKSLKSCLEAHRF